MPLARVLIENQIQCFVEPYTSISSAFVLVNSDDHIFDCSDLARYGITTSGVYTILSSKDVYCDLDTDGGGLVHQTYDMR